MFLHVSVCPQGWGLPHCMLGYTPMGRHPLWTDTPLGRSPGQTPHPSGQTPHPPGQTTTPAQCMQGYGQQAGSTHPTGMQSCFHYLVSSLNGFLDPIVTAMALEKIGYHSNGWGCSHCDGKGKPKILNLFVIAVAV